MGRRRRRRRKRRKEQAISQQGGFAGASGGSNTAAASSSKSGASSSTQKTTTSSWESPKTRIVASRQNRPGTLRLSPKVHAKLEWFRDRGPTEISGFGISAKEEPLYLLDFITIKQKASATSVEFDDDALNAYLASCVEQGWHPSEVMRIWLHTHPGNSASPSHTDMETFRDVFGGSEWSIMAILAKGGEFKAKFRYNQQADGIVGAVFGYGREQDLKVVTDLTPPFSGISADEYKAWEEEYCANILTRTTTTVYSPGGSRFQGHGSHHNYGHGCFDEYEAYSERERWYRGDNEGTEGFGSSSRDDDDDKDVGGLGTERLFHHRSIFEQDEIPEWGGSHRLEGAERDPENLLVSGSIEQVWQVEQYKEGSVVLTDYGWYEYGPDANIYCTEEDDIDGLTDISLELPVACGEITWRFVDGEYAPMKITRITEQGIVDLREDASAADIELGIFERQKKKEEAATGSNGAPGFGEPTGATGEAEETEPSKSETQVVSVEDIEKEVEKNRANAGSNPAANSGTGTGAGTAGATGPALLPTGDDGATGFAGP